MLLTCILQLAQVDVAIPAPVPGRVEMGLLGAWSQRLGAPDNFYRAAATSGLQARRGPAHPATHRGPNVVMPTEDEPSAPIDKTSMTTSGPNGEEPWSLQNDQALGGKPSTTAARDQGL
jgi:hypothetical protein